MHDRESMEYDVVIVGGGPAGLAASIRLKQLAPKRAPMFPCASSKKARDRRAYPVRCGGRSDRARRIAARLAG
jgi:electron-transferring-flavoprotein dehydrogenase